MKVSQIGAAVVAGEILITGTYFSGRVQRINVRDKNSPNGARKDLLITKEVVLTKKEPITVSRFLPDATLETEKAWVPSAKQGDTVICRLTGLQEDLGNKSANGAIEVAEPETAK